MSDGPNLPPLTLSASGTLTEDLRCARCGYNLRGLTLESLCPECGTAIARSVHGNLLRYADPAWVDKLRLGTVVKLWNLLLGVVLVIAAGIAAGLAVGPMALGVLQLIVACLSLWAVFLVTTPEPAVGLEEDPITLRKVLRTAAIIGFCGGQLQHAAAGGGVPWLILTGAASGLAGIVATFGEFVYFRRFARRAPDENLAKATTTVMWGFVTLLTLFALAGLVAALAGLTGAPGGPAGGTPTSTAGTIGAVFLGIFGFLGFAVFGIWSIVLLFRYHAVFRKAATEGRQLEAGRSLSPPANQSDSEPQT